MKKFIATIVLIALLFSLTACGKSNEETSPVDVTTQKNTKIDGNESSKDEFDSIDTANGLKMKMYGDYYCAQDGLTNQFFDGEVLVSYTRSFDKTTSNEPKSIDDFIARFPILIQSRIFAEADNCKLSFTKEKEMNGFKVKEFNGTITDDYNEVHNCKAYTFICGGYDCIVIAAPIENTDEMIEKMNKDIDIFMNNLEVDK